MHKQQMSLANEEAAAGNTESREAASNSLTDAFIIHSARDLSQINVSSSIYHLLSNCKKDYFHQFSRACGEHSVCNIRTFGNEVHPLKINRALIGTKNPAKKNKQKSKKKAPAKKKKKTKKNARRVNKVPRKKIKKMATTVREVMRRPLSPNDPRHETHKSLRHCFRFPHPFISQLPPNVVAVIDKTDTINDNLREDAALGALRVLTFPSSSFFSH